MDTRLNASDSVACVDAIKGNFNTLEYSLAKHISHVPTKLNGVEFTDENAESWGGVTPPHTPPLATPLTSTDSDYNATNSVTLTANNKFQNGNTLNTNDDFDSRQLLTTTSHND